MEDNCGQETNGEHKVFQFTVLIVARLDTWIINVLLCMVPQKVHGGQRQKKNVGTFWNILSITMRELSNVM